MMMVMTMTTAAGTGQLTHTEGSPPTPPPTPPHPLRTKRAGGSEALIACHQDGQSSKS